MYLKPCTDLGSAHIGYFSKTFGKFDDYLNFQSGTCLGSCERLKRENTTTYLLHIQPKMILIFKKAYRYIPDTYPKFKNRG